MHKPKYFSAEIINKKTPFPPPNMLNDNAMLTRKHGDSCNVNVWIYVILHHLKS